MFDAVPSLPTVLGQVTVGSDPSSVAVHDDRYAYVANSASGTVSVVDLLPRTVVKTITVGSERLNGGASLVDLLVEVGACASKSRPDISTIFRTSENPLE